MKKIVILLFAIATFATLYAQVPKGFNYQAVVRNSAGHLMSNRNISVNISILQGTDMGTVVYNQESAVTTNQNGLFTLIVGDNSNDFANINWANGPYFIKSEIDLNGGRNYTLSTTQKILAVPYAHYANTARTADGLTGGIFLTLNGDTLSISGGNYVVLPPSRRGTVEWDSVLHHPTRLSEFINDLNFHVSGDTLFINGDTYIILPSGSATSVEWDSVRNHPIYLSQFINDLNFHVSGDTLYMGDTYVLLSDLITSIEWDSVRNHPIYLSQFINDLNFHVSGDTLYMGDTYVLLADLITTIEWDSVLNRPTHLSQFTNDLGLDDVIAVNNNAYNQIKNVYNPTDPLDAANKAYVDSSLAAEVAALNARIDSLNNRLDSLNNTYINYFDSVNNRIYQLEHPTVPGALPGIFSVSATTRINFSQGNLQYRPFNNTWRFATTQYSVAGANNNNIILRNACKFWIDLFGYGTSGWNSGAPGYMPYESTSSNTDYTNYTEDPNGNDLTDLYANADWGFFNPIMNGGNQSGMWRTLTSTEWNYLLTLRPNASLLRGMATVENTPGYVILPDDWTCPTGMTFVNTDTSYTTNVYNAANWSTMESAGAVFLPAAGQRTSSTTTNVGTVGNYWSTSHVNGTTGYAFHIAPSANAVRNDISYSTGCSVRLVRIY